VQNISHLKASSGVMLVSSAGIPRSSASFNVMERLMLGSTQRALFGVDSAELPVQEKRLTQDFPVVGIAAPVDRRQDRLRLRVFHGGSGHQNSFQFFRTQGFEIQGGILSSGRLTHGGASSVEETSADTETSKPLPKKS
jgi:hypothetical protein